MVDTYSKSCRLCDSIHEPDDEVINITCTQTWTPFLKIMEICMPNINLDSKHSICKSCFDHVINFNTHKAKWLRTEYLIHAKREEGKFKGLRDIIEKMKRDSSHICRLCLKETDTQEVIYIYLDNQVYYKGYITDALKIHSPMTDLDLTENPMICQECLDVIQTFDAFHQMCLEVQSACKKNKKSRTDKQKTVHVQLQKTSDNSAVFRQVTESEKAVSNIETVTANSSCANMVINGWTTKNVFDFVNKGNILRNRLINENNSKSGEEILVISDDEGSKSSIDFNHDEAILYPIKISNFVDSNKYSVGELNKNSDKKSLAGLEFIDTTNMKEENEKIEIDLISENENDVFHKEEDNVVESSIHINMSEIFQKDGRDVINEPTGTINIVSDSSPNLEIIELDDSSDDETSNLNEMNPKPYFTIDMSKLEVLFSDSQTNTEQTSNTSIEGKKKSKRKEETPKIMPALEINMSDMFDKQNAESGENSNASRASELKTDLSDFLTFRKFIEDTDELRDFVDDVPSMLHNRKRSGDPGGAYTSPKKITKVDDQKKDAFGNLKIEYFSLEKASFTDVFAKFVRQKKNDYC